MAGAIEWLSNTQACDVQFRELAPFRFFAQNLRSLVRISSGTSKFMAAKSRRERI
jgi:hypothetical protein